MDLYRTTSYRLAERLTKDYSTSFSMSSRLFDPSIQKHIYAIYGLVRVADEIVDTYQGNDAEKTLDDLEHHTLEQLKSKTPFSANPIVHAFVITAQEFGIDESIIRPFFESMRIDLVKKSFTQEEYAEYIYGSAEVIGLMCLKVFTVNRPEAYEQLRPGAQALGSAYQKINFLRDMKSDYVERQRCYFPGVTFDTFDDTQKKEIEADIAKDLATGYASLKQLPPTVRKAILTSYRYYQELLTTLKKASAQDIKTKRLRVPNAKKLAIYATAKALPL